jgi:hypothetical protein
MARRTAGTQASHTDEKTTDSRLHLVSTDGVLSFGETRSEFSDDTVIGVTDEVVALLNSISLGTSHDAGLEASLGWNFFSFG